MILAQIRTFLSGILLHYLSHLSLFSLLKFTVFIKIVFRKIKIHWDRQEKQMFLKDQDLNRLVDRKEDLIKIEKILVGNIINLSFGKKNYRKN